MSLIIDNIRLPDRIERGSRGGPAFNTTILSGANFDETAIQNWAKERRSWDVSYGVQSKTDYQEILTFFRGRRGAARGFLFKDWADYTMPRQSIGTGDGVETLFTLNYTNTDTVLPYTRKITHLDSATLSVWVNNVLQSSPIDYTFSLGTITFTTPPANTLDVEAAVSEYYIPVRFGIDEIKVELFWEGAGTIPEIPIIEAAIQ